MAKCLNCGDKFHWCTSCGCDGYMERGYCCPDCMGESLEKKESELAAEREKVERLEAKYKHYYTGDGLDELAMKVQHVIEPLTKHEKPDHAVQVAIRMILDTLAAALNPDGEK